MIKPPARGGCAAVLFDLDGTLLDTAPDLAFALATVMREQSREPLPIERVRPYVSRGAAGLIDVGFGTGLDPDEFTALRNRILAVYAANLCRETRLFPGMDAVLADLERRNLPWGIVTNKPARFTNPLLESLELTARAASVVSGDSTARPKPDPGPLLLAANLMRVDPLACIYIGDDQRDVVAARAAGMRSVVALYGYLGPDSDPPSWQADDYVADPEALSALFAEIQ